MSIEFRDFLMKLATEPDLMARYMTDPSDVMESEGLPDECRAAMVSGDIYQIHALVNPPANDDSETASATTNATAINQLDENSPEYRYYQSYLWWQAATTGVAPPESASDYSQWSAAANEPTDKSEEKAKAEKSKKNKSKGNKG